MDDATVFYSGPIVTRQEARAAGSTNYFTGRSCVRGHVALRNTKEATCTACKNENLKQWGERNRDKLRAYRLKLAPSRKTRLRRWKQENKQRHCDLNRASRARTVEKARDRAKRYAKANPHIVRVCGQNRRARERAASGRVTKADIDFLMLKQRARCVYCAAGLRLGYHVDHIVPLALGGTHSRRNLQLLCPPCNQAKAAKHPADFARERGFLL